jgi:hypothetical protein
MKTKNFLLTGALLIVALFSVNGVMAEGPSDYAQSDQTTVNIILNPMQAILVNDDVVNLEYTTLDDYNEGVEITVENHLTVYSVGGFIVNVKSDGDFKNESNSTIPASDVKISATAAGDSPGTTFALVTLSTSETPLITSTIGGFAKNYNVNYSNIAGQAFAYANLEEDTYTAKVTYEIIPAN